MKTQHVTCAHCMTINRVPMDRAIEQAKCGRCQSSLVRYQPTNLTDRDFDAFVMKSDLPVVVDVWASWCGPCMQFAPIFEQAAAGWEPRVRFAKVDADMATQISQRLAIRSIPTLILFHKGTEIDRRSGALPAQMFDQWLEQNVSAIH